MADPANQSWVALLAQVVRLLASMGNFLRSVRRNPTAVDRRIVAPITTRAVSTVHRLADRIWIWLGGGHVIGPTAIGKGDHDCALASLYWAAPWIPETRIIEAFGFCTETWPYGGITNKELQIALKYLNVDKHYSTDTETLGALLNRKPTSCVALVPGHFIAIVDGKIVGRDAKVAWDSSTTVYGYWTFHSRQFQPAENKRCIFGGTT